MAAKKKIYRYQNSDYIYDSEKEILDNGELEEGDEVSVYELVETLVFKTSLVSKTKKTK